MAKVAAQYPDDLDAITLYADALFILEPRRGTRDVNAPNIKKLHAVLESALKEFGQQFVGSTQPAAVA